MRLCDRCGSKDQAVQTRIETYAVGVAGGVPFRTEIKHACGERDLCEECRFGLVEAMNAYMSAVPKQAAAAQKKTRKTKQFEGAT